VRYIHLNPLRAALVPDLDALDRYPYSGHSTLTGIQGREWQDTEAVLGQFGERVGVARRAYRAFVEAGIAMGSRPELVGGGLIRSLGGWEEAVRVMRPGSPRLKGDERILGDPAFVLGVLGAGGERLSQQEALRRQGYDLDRVARRAAMLCGLAPEAISGASKRPNLVAARSLFCFWAVRELGETATAVARLLGLTQPAVSSAVRRGEEMVRVRGLRLVEK
jgi:DNA-binding transcriptional LysR family regulator